MRNGVVCVLTISFGLLICGCAELIDRMDFGRQPQQTNLDAQDENICRSRGVTPDYYSIFLDCKKQLANERASAEAAAKASRQEGDDNMIPAPGR